jgi:hypothetical protein
MLLALQAARLLCNKKYSVELSAWLNQDEPEPIQHVLAMLEAAFQEHHLSAARNMTQLQSRATNRCSNMGIVVLSAPLHPGATIALGISRCWC